MINNTNVDLVHDDVCTKFGLILSICSQVIEKKNRFWLESRPVTLNMAYLQKIMIYNANVDLVICNVYIKFGIK